MVCNGKPLATRHWAGSARGPPVPTASRNTAIRPQLQTVPRHIDLGTKCQIPHFPQQMSLLEVLCKLNFYKSNCSCGARKEKCCLWEACCVPSQARKTARWEILPADCVASFGTRFLFLWYQGVVWHARASVCVCMCVCRPVNNIRYLPLSLFTLFSELWQSPVATSPGLES